MPTLTSRDGSELALHDLGGRGRPLLLTHGNGLVGAMWAPVADRLPDVHSWALDLRGHGASAPPAGSGSPDPESLHYLRLVDDVAAAARHLGGGDGPPLVAAGHSLGGACLLAVEAREPGTFGALWVFEPVVFPAPLRHATRANPLADRARRRRATFADRADAEANFAAKPPFDRVAAAALRAYVDHGLLDRADGTVGLACRPETEAAVFELWTENDTFDHLVEVTCPVTVVRGSLEGPGPAAFASSVVDALPRGRLVDRPDLTHFGPFEDPEGIAVLLQATLLAEPGVGGAPPT